MGGLHRSSFSWENKKLQKSSRCSTFFTACCVILCLWARPHIHIYVTHLIRDGDRRQTYAYCTDPNSLGHYISSCVSCFALKLSSLSYHHLPSLSLFFLSKASLNQNSSLTPSDLHFVSPSHEELSLFSQHLHTPALEVDGFSPFLPLCHISLSPLETNVACRYGLFKKPSQRLLPPLSSPFLRFSFAGKATFFVPSTPKYSPLPIPAPTTSIALTTSRDRPKIRC